MKGADGIRDHLAALLPSSQRGWIRTGLVLVLMGWTVVTLIPVAVQAPSVVAPIVGITAFALFQVWMLARVDRLTKVVARLERDRWQP